jgi:hypothetical protein
MKCGSPICMWILDMDIGMKIPTNVCIYGSILITLRCLT